jgi:hypothetical protein
VRGAGCEEKCNVRGAKKRGQRTRDKGILVLRQIFSLSAPLHEGHSVIIQWSYNC